MVINISNYENNIFQGTIQIQSSRPIFNSSYESSVYNYIDKDFSFQYYFYIEVEDNPGVMASITTALAESNIGIESMVQKEDLGNNLVPIILISDIFKENKLEGIKDKILSLSSVTNLRTIRIESTD